MNKSDVGSQEKSFDREATPGEIKDYKMQLRATQFLHKVQNIDIADLFDRSRKD